MYPAKRKDKPQERSKGPLTIAPGRNTAVSRSLAVLAALISLIVVSSADAETKTVAEWGFDKPGDSMGWSPGRGITDVAVRDGCLVGRTVERDPFIHGPLFEIPAKPNQYVEIRMKTSSDGYGELFYTNTTEPPYEGFRPEKLRRIDYRAGGFRTYHIFPFWHGEEKIIRLRLDPPEDAEFEVDYIKVVEIVSPESNRVFFDFTKPEQAWVASIPVELGDSGMVVRSKEEVLLVSPELDFDAADYPWLAVNAQGTVGGRIVLQWVTDDHPGVRSRTIHLKPGGARVYNIPAEELPDWSGRIRMLALVIPPSERPVTVSFAGACEAPKGPPQLAITYFGLRDPISRTGQTAVVQVTVTNDGGETAHDIKAYLRVPENRGPRLTNPNAPGGVIEGESVRRISALKPGESATLTWNVKALGVGVLSRCALSVSAPNATAMHESASVRWYPAVEAGKADYVPEPKPVRGPYEVGIYYYPGWPTYTKWSVLDDFPERRPLLGYYREGDPEVADWHIKWMVEHGITFIVYDWYWSMGGRHLEHAIHQGLFNARYRDKIKFCLLWANHNAPKTSSAEDMVNVTNYWLDNYFLRDEYMKVDGKPIVIIFSPHRLTEDMGIDGVRAAFDKSREIAKARGLNGIYFVACSYPGRGGLETLEKEGYDAVSGYNYPSAGDKGRLVAPYADMVTGFRDIWNAIQDNTSLPYIPVTEPGWDSRPWHGPNARVRTGKTPELFKQMLRNARTFVDNRKVAGPRMVLIEAWNEFGEGDYVEPHQEWGFGHVDAIREVFTLAPTDHTDLVPQDVGLGPYELEKPAPASAWEFDDPIRPGWDAIQNLTNARVENGRLIAESSGSDPAMYGEATDLDSKSFRWAEIRMKVDKGRGAQLFWAGKARGFSEPSSARFDIIADGEFHVYRLDLDASPAWKGRIGALRLDPCDVRDAHIEVDYIRLVP